MSLNLQRFSLTDYFRKLTRGKKSALPRVEEWTPSHRPIRLTPCCTQFKSPGVKILCVLYLHYNVAFSFKCWKFLKQNVLFPKCLNWVQHWVSRIGLLSLYIVHLTDLYLNMQPLLLLISPTTRIQRRALSIIIPLLHTRSYEDALAGIARLRQRREDTCVNFVKELVLKT